MSNGYRINWPMRIASVLLCLVLLTTCLSFGLYARYTASGTAGDSARVIKFGKVTLTERGDFVQKDGKNEFIIAPGFELEKDVTVSFEGSESATYLFVIVNASGWEYDSEKNCYSYGDGLLSFSVDSYDSSTKNGWNRLDNSIDTFVFYKHLSPNESVKDTLFKEDQGKHIFVSAEVPGDTFKNLEPISISILATVVQSNGFNNVTEAWNSVKDN